MIRSLKLLIIISAAILLTTTAFARFGGGGGYSGGGGFSGGGFSGGGYSSRGYSGGGITFQGTGSPAINIFIILVFVVIPFIYKMYYSPQQRIVRSTARVNQRGIVNGLQKLKQRDPQFNENIFFERCRKICPILQDAWTAQDVTNVRHFMSDGLYENISLQLKMLKACRIKNVISDVRVLNCTLIDVESDTFFDTLHVAITAQANDKMVRLDDNKIIPGTSTSEPFREIWTFLRRPGTKTLQNSGLLEGYCPNCGTKLKISASTTCSSCNALINSGEYDWVLSEITQDEAWSSNRRSENIAGLANFCLKDPGFNRQSIDDRMNAIFWHLRASEFFADKKYISAVALPSFTENEQQKWTPDENGNHLFYADPAVGSIDIAEISQADTPNDFDRIRVRVKWSGHMERAKFPKFMKPDYTRSRLIQQDFILVRKYEVESNTAKALRSQHCDGCGAAQTSESLGTCEYCGRQQNDGSANWVLESIKPAGSFATTRPAQNFSKVEKEHAIQCMIAVMSADGEISRSEIKYLKQMAKHRGISEQKLQEMLNLIKENGEFHMFNSNDRTEQHDFLLMLIRMCLADGKITQTELKLIKQLVKQFGYTDIDIKMMIKNERQTLLDANKQILKKL